MAYVFIICRRELSDKWVFGRQSGLDSWNAELSAEGHG